MAATNITNYPYSSNPFTSECWFRTETFGSTPLYWGRSPTRYNGNTADGDEVSLNVGSPASVSWSSDGSGGVTAATVPAAGQWYQVAATYENGTSRIYVNGQLDGAHTGAMSLYNNIQLKIGGARNSYQFAGDIDEVRVSQVARSANWMKLQYENQKPLQTLVGNPVQAGSSFTVTPGAVTLAEGTSTTLSAQAGGAQKVYWIKKQNGVETVIGVDRFTLDYAAGRVTGNQVFSLQFKAIYPTETKTIDIPFTITEDLPDPVFTLTAPATWDGRQTITVTPNISNLAALQAKGVATCNASWSVTGFAVNKTITPEGLTLSYSQGSGPLTVTLTLDNGGSRVTQTQIITVQLPAVEPWVQRSPDADEKPVDNQFFARDDTGQGTIHYRGTLAGSADTVYLKVYATPAGDTESLLDTLRQTPGTGGSYAFSARVAPGLIQYKVVFGSTTGTTDTPLATVSNLVCGDAYLIDGQSNSEARNSDNPVTSEWVRTFTGSWGNASRTVDLSSWPVGYWGLSLALQLVNDYQIPVCIINVGRSGTRIDEHLSSPHSDSYGTVAAAKLTHGIRGVLWHQGESDQASDPNGVPYYQSYQQKFLDMSMVWKTDYPNLQHYYVFQIYPHACGSAWDGSDDKLREVQRTLSRLYSNLRVMSTLGLPGYDGCHYNAAGYEALAQLICPLVEQDNNGRNASEVLTAPDLQQAWFTTAAHTEIALAFNQNMAWNSGVPGLIDLDGVGGLISSGSVSGKVIKLQLTTAATAQTIDYLIGRGGWAQANILYGSNGIPALTFYGVPIAPSPPATLTATAGDGQVTLNWAASAGATGYQIKRALTAGGPYTVIGSATGTSFTDSTAANGTTYRYVVSATISVGDRVGESPDSAETSATPVGLFTSWIGGYFTTPGDPRRDSGADPDHDGMSNFHEFAFGLDPAVGASANPCTPLLGTRFSYTRRADSGLSYTVEYSTDLTNWNPATVSESAGAADSNGVQTVTVTVSNPALNGKLFVRVKAL